MIHPSNQRLFAAPAINQVYEEGQKDIITSPKFQGRKLVVCGGDSEGFSATKATYSFMEHGSNIVLHMEHGDKRQVRELWDTISAVPSYSTVISYTVNHDIHVCV